MSVIVTLRMKGDPNKLEEVAAGRPDTLREIADRAKERGVIAHRFYGSDDGEIMVIDEWPDAESFQTFFQEQQERIGPLMQEVGIQAEPEITFWRKLESHDEIGWGA
jgi:quinol monooxygenase YgiN